MIIHNLKLVLRRLQKNKLHSFIGIGSFAIGITICLIIGLYIYNELTVDTCYKNHDRIYRMIDAERNRVWIDYDEKDIYLETFPEIEAVCPIELSTNWDRPVYNGERAVFIQGFITTDNTFFEMFSIPIIASLSSRPFANVNSAVLTETASKQLFDDIDPLGKEIILDGEKPLIISAIIKDFPANTSINANILLNAENNTIRASFCGDGNGHYYYAVNLYLQLNQQASSKILTEKINNTSKQLGVRVEQVDLRALDDIYLNRPIEGNDNRSGNIIMIIMFSAIGLLILFLSTINHVNFVLSHQLTRLKEIGVKKTTGAGFIQLMMYFLVEVTAWLFISLILSLITVEMILPFTNQLFNRSLEFMNIASPPFLLAIIFFIGLIVFISSLAPTFILSKFNIQNFISQQFGIFKKNTVRKVLTVFQFSVAIVLLICVMTIQKQMRYVKYKNIGFNDEHLLWIDLPVNYMHSQALKDQLLQSPSVQSASLSMGNPGNIRYGTGDVGIDGNYFQIMRIDADDSFLNTLGITILKGRNFLKGDQGKSCLINETAYKKYGWENIEGKKFQEFNVVGVINDFHVSSMHKEIAGVSIVYNPYKLTSLSLRIKPENISETMDYIKNIWYSISPNSPYNYHFYDEWFDAMYRDEDRLTKTLTMFTIIAFIITCLGLLSQSFQTCINRTKEIGIRKVLGASVSNIVLTLTKDFSRLALLANLFAWPIVWIVIRMWLQNFAYRTNISVWQFLIAGVITLLITLFTVSWQAIRSALANPVKALRYE